MLRLAPYSIASILTEVAAACIDSCSSRCSTQQNVGEFYDNCFPLTVLHKIQWKAFFIFAILSFREFYFSLGNSVFRHEKLAKKCKKENGEKKFFLRKKPPCLFSLVCNSRFLHNFKKAVKKKKVVPPSGRLPPYLYFEKQKHKKAVERHRTLTPRAQQTQSRAITAYFTRRRKRTRCYIR